jgi:hypothetical protein
MLRLASVLYAIIGTTCAGVGVVAVLTLGYFGVVPILVGAGIGAVLGVPASWMVAGKLRDL